MLLARFGVEVHWRRPEPSACSPDPSTSSQTHGRAPDPAAVSRVGQCPAELTSVSTARTTRDPSGWDSWSRTATASAEFKIRALERPSMAP